MLSYHQSVGQHQRVRRKAHRTLNRRGQEIVLDLCNAYGDSMNQAGIDEGDLVVALTNNENNLKRIHFDDKKKVIVLCPESSNPNLLLTQRII